MKLIHLSDLHIGKRINSFSMLEDQRYILARILGHIREEAPAAVLIAGDVYDQAVPSAEAVGVLDSFLVQLSGLGIPAMIISGNHDSPERLAFASRLLRQSGVYLSPVYEGWVQTCRLSDAHGPVTFHLLPFIKPAQVRHWAQDEEISSYTDALRAAIGAMNIAPQERNVLLTHQFITGASRSDSEELSVGGSDNVDGSVFSAFDYVALGHLHSPQSACGPRVRYCGSPLKYSFSECAQQKSLTVVELEEKGSVTVRLLPLVPLRDMREMRGLYDRVLAAGLSVPSEDYLHITLTDEEDIPDAMGTLRGCYPHLMRLSYDNQRTRSAQKISTPTGEGTKSPLALFEELYVLQNNQSMTREQRDYCRQLIEHIWEGEV